MHRCMGEAEGELRESDRARPCIAVLKDLKLSKSCPIYKALMTVTGGGDGERDIVIMIDLCQLD